MPKPSSSYASLLLAAVGWMATAQSARAQYDGYDVPGPPIVDELESPPISSPRVAAKFALGLFGAVVLDDDEPGTTSRQDDMLVTYGFGAEFDYPLHRFFTVGLGAELLWMNLDTFDDAGIGRSLTLDVDLIGRVRYPMKVGSLLLEPMLGLMIGLSFNWLDDENIEAQFPGWQNIETSSKLGWNLGILPGAILWLTRRLGLMLEIGWIHHAHAYEFSWSSPTLGPGTNDIDTAIDEMLIHLGVTFAF